MVSKNKKNNFFFDFTIITIVKNDEKNIENTIKSVLSQKKIKVQYIVLDGHSSDKTYSIIKKYKTTCLKNEGNKKIDNNEILNKIIKKYNGFIYKTRNNNFSILKKKFLK